MHQCFVKLISVLCNNINWKITNQVRPGYIKFEWHSSLCSIHRFPESFLGNLMHPFVRSILHLLDVSLPVFQTISASSSFSFIENLLVAYSLSKFCFQRSPIGNYCLKNFFLPFYIVMVTWKTEDILSDERRIVRVWSLHMFWKKPHHKAL